MWGAGVYKGGRSGSLYRAGGGGNGCGCRSARAFFFEALFEAECDHHNT